MHKIALAGAGNIGSALLRLIVESAQALDQGGKPLIEVRSVLVRDLNKARPGLPPGLRLVNDPAQIIEDGEIQTVVELMGGVEEAFKLASAALRSGKSVVTANKNLLAERGPELFALAKEKGLSIGFEAAVCAGIPIIRALQESLRADPILCLEGILNGTTNYILTRMTEEGLDYGSALKDAQRLGFAEPDPHNDVSGIDSVCKLGILSSLAFGAYTDYRNIPVSGIENIDAEDLRQAARMGYRVKLLGSARRGNSGGVEAGVSPVLLPLSHPLAAVRNEYNAVLVESRGLGHNLFMGRGAGPEPTSVSLLADILDIAEGRAWPIRASHPFLEKARLSEEESRARFYLRISVPDRPGVLAQVSSLFAAEGISIASVLQPETALDSGRERVPLILTTHGADAARMAALTEKLGAAGWGSPVLLKIIED